MSVSTMFSIFNRFETIWNRFRSTKLEEIVTFSLSSTFPSNLSPQQDRSLVKTCPNLCRDSLLKRREKVPFKKGKRLRLNQKNGQERIPSRVQPGSGKKSRLDFIPGTTPGRDVSLRLIWMSSRLLHPGREEFMPDVFH